LQALRSRLEGATTPYTGSLVFKVCVPRFAIVIETLEIKREVELLTERLGKTQDYL